MKINDFAYIRVVRDFIWYGDGVSTSIPICFVRKLRRPKSAHFFLRTKLNSLKSIAHNVNMSTKRKTSLLPVKHQSSKRGRLNKGYWIEDAVKLVSRSCKKRRRMSAMLNVFLDFELNNFSIESFWGLHKLCTNKFFAGYRQQNSTWPSHMGLSPSQVCQHPTTARPGVAASILTLGFEDSTTILVNGKEGDDILKQQFDKHFYTKDKVLNDWLCSVYSNLSCKQEG